MVGQPILDPSIDVSLYSIMVEFICQKAVTNLVKSFGKIPDEELWRCMKLLVSELFLNW